MSAHNSSIQQTVEVIPPKKSQKGGVARDKHVRVGKQTVTPKQAKMVVGMAHGKSATQAALDAYDTDDRKTASVIAAENLGKPNVRAALQQVFESKGLTIESAAAVIQDALGANKSTTGTVYEKDEDGGQIRSGVTLIETDIPDHSIRLQAAKTALSLMGADKDPDDGSGPLTFNFKSGANVFIKAEN